MGFSGAFILSLLRAGTTGIVGGGGMGTACANNEAELMRLSEVAIARNLESDCMFNKYQVNH